MISLLRGVLGLVLILGIALLFSNNRRRISWRLVSSGIGLQVVFAVFILYSDKLSSWFRPLGWPKALISRRARVRFQKRYSRMDILHLPTIVLMTE
jgi:CNT family concentrative nucleoside transporter